MCIKRQNRFVAVILSLAMILSLAVVDVHATTTTSGNITLKGYNAPTNIDLGKTFSIKGKIKAKSRINKVEIGIYNKQTGKWKYKYTKSGINKKSFNIKKADKTLKFGKLKAGTYYYRIYVKLKGKKKKRVLSQKFTVVDNNAETIPLGVADSSGISLSKVRAPGTYMVGKEFKPTGIVTSDSKIKKVEVGIVYAPTNKWLEYKYNAKVNGNSFDLSSAASKLRFDLLPGGEYRYRMYVHTENGVKIAFNKVFTVKPSGRPQAAVNWAVAIANNDEFSYGKKPQTSKVGCFFCGTNQKRKPEGYEKTYVCLTFVEAAYAHGAGDPEMLAECQAGNHTMLANEYNLTKYKCWQKIGLARDLTVNDLLPGDVLVYYTANGTDNGHVAIFVGGNSMVDAEGIKDCWGPDSIAVRDKAAAMLVSAARFSSKSYVMRYRF